MDLIIDNECGLLTPPRDAESLAKALIQLIDDESLRKRLGAAPHERIVQHFSLERMVSEYRRVTSAASQETDR